MESGGASTVQPDQRQLGGTTADQLRDRAQVHPTTRTETGLRCRARLDTKEYATGLNVTKAQKAKVHFGRRRILSK